MAKINILQPEIYNKIAAGEVVERPASVIKELIENSIDAGASHIDIEITEGGISLMRVSDDGQGMDKEDLTKSVMPHATSKIRDIDDLFDINTLGFRGEALASIASVSKLSITSRAEGDYAYILSVNGGAIDSIVPCGRARGTTIEVKDLFYNTPVRLKFLKKPKQEEKEITACITQLIFANPEICFSYIADGITIFNTAGGLKNVIYSIYGNEIAQNLVYHERVIADIRVSGYVGKQGFGKHSRNYQTAVINGRVVSNQIISTAVAQAYGTTLMTRTYPVYVLSIDMPNDMLDVNVHPNKREVRFKDSNTVFAAVYKTVMSALAQQNSYLQLSKEEGKDSVQVNPIDKANNDTKKIQDIYNNAPNSEQFSNFASDIPDKSSTNNINASLQAGSGVSALQKDNKEFNLSKSTKESINTPSISDKLRNKFSSEKQSSSNSIGSVRKTMVAQPLSYNTAPLPQNKPAYNMSSPLFDAVDKELAGDYSVIGQIFKTFLIIERKDKVYLIDQHAVHEKFIYDEYVKQTESNCVSSQQLLVPFIFDADSDQYDYINKISADLFAIGFDIEQFGGLKFKVSAIPHILTGIDLDMFFNDICADKIGISNLKLSNMIKSQLMQRACKRAIKSGDRLSNANIAKLFNNMDNGIPMQCPHGRPAVLEFSRTDLDKLFKRIV